MATAVTEIFNPSTGDVVDTVPKGTREDAKRAVDAAEVGFKAWSKVAPATRGEILFKAARMIDQNIKDLSETLTKEQGKPIREAQMEITRFRHTLEYYAGLGKNLRSIQIPIAEGRFGMVLRLPIGICAAITPWNFPVSLLGNKIAPGLLAGNSFVIKPAGTTPLTTIKVCDILTKAGLPEGTLNVVSGPGSQVGQEFLENAKIHKVGFTGATDTGKNVMRTAADTLKHVTLELGGSDPMIICDDADLDEAISSASVGTVLQLRTGLPRREAAVCVRIRLQVRGRKAHRKGAAADGRRRLRSQGPPGTAAYRRPAERG